MAKSKKEPFANFKVHVVTYKIFYRNVLWSVAFTQMNYLNPFFVEVMVDDQLWHNDDAKYCTLKEAIKWIVYCQDL
jgi:ABC-type bacteriocin/lantibiotic exporter with double-glycine peptidase domain